MLNIARGVRSRSQYSTRQSTLLLENSFRYFDQMTTPTMYVYGSLGIVLRHVNKQTLYFYFSFSISLLS